MEIDLFQQAFTFRKQKEYAKAINIYQSLWEQNKENFNDWAGWSYGFCLKETRKYQEALGICRLIYKRFPESSMVKQLYASCIYYTQFTNKEMPDITTSKKAVQAMVDLCPPDQKYSLTPKAIFKLTKQLMSQTNIKWLEIEYWLKKMDPDLLDHTPFTMIDPFGKTKEYASPLEEWYSVMIKVQAGLNDPLALLELLAMARKRQLKWHYNNQIWFARKEAFAYLQLGEKERAQKILRQIISQKKEWFILQDLAQIVSDKEESLRLFSEAALAFGDPDKKIKLYQNLYQLLNNKPEYENETKLHLKLIYLIRKQAGWQIPSELEKAINKHDIKLKDNMNLNDYIKQLIPFWEKIVGCSKNIIEGIITKILDNNQAGFIRSTLGKDHYFSMKEAKQIGNKILVGTSVLFELVEGFDKKKNITTQNAVRLILK